MRSFLLAALLVPADLPNRDAPNLETTYQESLVGRWRLVEVNGRPDNHTVTFTADMIVSPPKGYPYKIDSAQRPRHFNFINCPGIYRLTGDTLIVCFEDYTRDERLRPTKFQLVEGRIRQLWIFKRITDRRRTKKK